MISLRSGGPAPLQAWIDRYEFVKSQGRIPDSPRSPYPAGTNMGQDGACSWTVNNCFGNDDIHQSPAGRVGLSFDVSLHEPIIFFQ